MTETRRLQMTAAEIAASYRGAKDKRAQIPILAQLNAVTEDEIRAVLEDLGEPVPKKEKRKAGRPRKEPVRVEEETREARGLSPQPPEATAPLYSKGEPSGNAAREEPEAAAMSAGTLADILGRVAEAFPGAEVRTAGGAPAGAALTVRWNAEGVIAETVLTIETERKKREC